MDPAQSIGFTEGKWTPEFLQPFSSLCPQLIYYYGFVLVKQGVTFSLWRVIKKWTNIHFSGVNVSQCKNLITSYCWVIKLPRWCSCKQTPCQFRRCKSCGLNPWFRKTPRAREWQPAPVFLPGKFHGQRSLAGYIVHRVAKSRTWLKQLSMHAHTYISLSYLWKYSLLYPSHFHNWRVSKILSESGLNVI